ncbi:hypothetical protein QUB11_13095 [Microcoleus sp. B6-A1]|uniref:hypothetical protein n=1 Tax=Microcoleus sp. B6-A1 TaxID=2818684 RepID=UPI002FD3A886
MTKPTVSYRRIDQLKAIAFDRGFTNEDARQFGKLSKTATWEALLELYLVDGESLDTVLDVPLDTVLGSVDAVPELLDTATVDTVDAVLDIPLDTGETVANSRKQSDCLYTLTAPLDTVLGSVDAVPELLDTATVDSVDAVPELLDTVPEVIQTVASSRKQFDCLYTLTAPLDAVLESVDTLDWTNDGSFPVCGFTRQNSTSFLDWVDLGQLIALILASTGVFVLAMSMWRQINPLNLFPSPVRINIQIGTKL